MLTPILVTDHWARLPSFMEAPVAPHPHLWVPAPVSLAVQVVLLRSCPGSSSYRPPAASGQAIQPVRLCAWNRPSMLG